MVHIPPQCPLWFKSPNDDDNAPISPPKDVKACIPDFPKFGLHNCGNHRYNTENKNIHIYFQRFQRSVLRGQPRNLSGSIELACTKCNTLTPLSHLHDLPCGDLVCLVCLRRLIARVHANIAQNWRAIRHTRNQIDQLERQLHDAEIGGDPEETPSNGRAKKRRLSWPKISAFTNIRHENLEKECFNLSKRLLELAGLTCCGVSMRLGRLLACLPPETARDLWLIFQWVQDPPYRQRVCAWPDCGAYIAACCRWDVGASGYRYHCVVCQGNSQDCSRTIEQEQIKFPYLPKGQPALTPAR